MQSAALYDVVTLETVETDDIVVECPGTDLPTGPDNLAWKAADVFFQETNIPPYRDYHPIGEENPLPGRSWRRQQ